MDMQMQDAGRETGKASSASLKGPIVALAAFSAVANVLMLVSPIYMTQVYDRILPTRSFETLGALSLIALVALAVLGLVETVRQTLARKLAARYELAVMPRLISADDDGALGMEPQVAAKAQTVKRFLASSAFINLFDLPFLPLFLGLMFLAHPLLGWATAAGMALLVIVTLLNEWGSRRPGEMMAQAQALAARTGQDALGAREDVRAMGMGQAMAARWTQHALAAADAGESAGRVNARFYGLTRFVRQALQTLVLGLGAFLVIHGDMAASLIFAASIVSARALMPIEQVVGAWKAIAEARRAVRDVRQALALVTKAEAGRARIDLPAPTGHLSVKGLRYAAGMAADAPVLVNDVSFFVEPGQIAAIIGPSGSGKSTLLRLLSGALAPSSGDVRLDLFKLSDWPSAQRGRAFGYMAQQTVLFEGTVAQNIARFDAAATDASIIAAAERAQAHDFIATLPQGYNTPVGPGGVRLSGGQVQRIALARALHTEPAVLVLDEPNAHLDSTGEEALIRTLADERAKGRTVIVATHRTSLLAIADAVYLMEGGRLRPLPMQAKPMPGRGQVLPLTGNGTPTTAA